jgi:hypothetical protein
VQEHVGRVSGRGQFRRAEHQGEDARQLERMGDGLGDFRRKAFLIGLGLDGLLHRLDLLFHWLEGGSEHGGGQLGNVPAITDSGFNPFLN